MPKTSIRDEANILDSAAESAIKNKKFPFDVHVLTSNVPKDALETAAHDAVTSSHVVAIAVSPQYHSTVVRFGGSTKVKAADYDSIAKAGNAHFRSGEWADGINAIGVRAQASAQSRVAMAVSNEPVIVQEGLSTGAWIGIAILFASVVGFSAFMWRKWKRKLRESDEALERNALATTELVGRNTTAMLDNETGRSEGDFERRLAASKRRTAKRLVGDRANAPEISPEPVYSMPQGYAPAAPQTVVVDRGGGGNDLLTGMLIGDMMSHHHHHGGHTDHVVHERVVEREVERDNGGSSSSWDSGGGSWDSGGSSDAGGSSSSWDSGGSDFGGGGDSGGGGGDW